MMKVTQPGSFFFRAQPNPESLSRSLGERDNPPILLTEILTQHQAGDSRQQRDKPLGASHRQDPVFI
jgi:hypothetical protein